MYAAYGQCLRPVNGSSMHQAIVRLPPVVIPSHDAVPIILYSRPQQAKLSVFHVVYERLIANNVCIYHILWAA